MKHTILMLALAAAIAHSPRVWSAEEAPDERVIVALKLRHVAPSTMARWLSPLQTRERDAAPGAGFTPMVDTMLPNDADRELWARTIPANVARLRQTVQDWDTEPGRVQLEVQAARVAVSDMARLLATTPHTGDAESRMLILASTSPRVQSSKRALQDLVEGNRATLLLHQTFEAKARKLVTLATEEPPESPGGLQGELTPTINDDSTISFKLQLRGGAQERAARPAYTIINARDGDTVAFVLRDMDAASSQATVVFITALLPRPGAG